MSYFKFSVVLTTYINEKASNLNESLESVYNQSVPPSEVIVVVDGSIDDEQRQIINVFKRSKGTNIINLDTNQGRGKARNIGIENARYDYVAIMDSDDIACYTRFEESIKIITLKNVDLVCSFQEEFDHDTRSSLSIKRCPEKNFDIYKALNFTCVISNPTILFKKQIWADAGGYPGFAHCNEDYLFFLRLRKLGAKLYCIQKPLIKVRIYEEQRKRRAGFLILLEDIKFRIMCAREGHHSYFYALFTIVIFSFKRLSPEPIRKLLNSVWRKRKFS